MAHRLGRIAARTAPSRCWRPAPAEGHRQRRGRRIDLRRRFRWSGPRCAARAPGSWGPPFLKMLQPLAASAAAIMIGNANDLRIGHCRSYWAGAGERAAGVDAEGAGDLDGAGADGFGHALVLGDRGEQPARLVLLALLDHAPARSFRRRFRTTDCPGLANGCSRAITSSGLMLVEFQRGLADQRERRDRAAAGRCRPRSRDIWRSRACDRSAASATRGAGEQAPRRGPPCCRCPGQRVELLRRGRRCCRRRCR